jgi:hypothetical protein
MDLTLLTQDNTCFIKNLRMLLRAGQCVVSFPVTISQSHTRSVFRRLHDERGALKQSQNRRSGQRIAVNEASGQVLEMIGFQAVMGYSGLPMPFRRVWVATM